MRPVAFRVFDFKSIEDSEVCFLSGDGITVLAGQNEAGKTAVLTALRDFDREVGAAPTTQDYEPEERTNSNPRVSVEFSKVDFDSILSDLAEEKRFIPPEVVERLKESPTIWITRTLRTGQFSMDETLAAIWQTNLPSSVPGDATPAQASDGAASDTTSEDETEPEKARTV